MDGRIRKDKNQSSSTLNQQFHLLILRSRSLGETELHSNIPTQPFFILLSLSAKQASHYEYNNPQSQNPYILGNSGLSGVIIYIHHLI